MAGIIQDLRHGVRLLVKSPGFTAAAILVLALGIGANTAIFSVVNAVLLRPLPFYEPDRLVQLWHTPPQKSFPGMTRFSLSAANYLDWKAENHVFEQTALYGYARFNLTGIGNPEVIRAGNVEPSFFSVLGVQPTLGRAFAPGEDQPSRSNIVILTNAFWQNHFGSDPHVVGRTVDFDGKAFTIVGVMGPHFRKPDFAQVWTPLVMTDKERAVRGEHHFLGIARLKRGVDLKQAQAELTTISSRLEQQYPADDKGWGAAVVPLREETVGEVRPALLVLLGAVAFVLLIACANVANLVLAKTLGRQKEIAIRTALGASRAAVLRQILAETLILSISGAAFGLFLARFGITLMEKFLADQLPSSVEITLDAQVLTFTLFLALFAGILAGLLPAVRFTKTDIYEALRQGQSRGSSDSSGNKTRGLLVVSEVALSLVLLIGAGLMLRTLLQLSSVRPGFNPNNVLTAALPVPGTKFSTPAAESRFCVQLLEQLRATPGVLSAALIDSLPLDGGGSHQPIAVEGQPIVPMADQPEIDVRVISPGYLSTMRIPLLRGRDLNDADIVGRPPVVLISESVAKHFWPNDNPIGKHVTLTFSGKAAREVVGVVGDVKEDSLGQTRPTEALYWPLSQMTAQPGETWRAFGMSLAVRTSADPASATSAVSAAVHRVDPELPVVHVVRSEEHTS